MKNYPIFRLACLHYWVSREFFLGMEFISQHPYPHILIGFSILPVGIVLSLAISLFGKWAIKSSDGFSPQVLFVSYLNCGTLIFIFSVPPIIAFFLGQPVVPTFISGAIIYISFLLITGLLIRKRLNISLRLLNSLFQKII